MSILIFIVVIVALIVVHEFGHFVAAKLSGMRVDEFGLGYPPRAMTVAKVGETEYTLNWLPFGGFVKIFGEDPSTALGAGGDDRRAFSKKTRAAQAIVLVAGVAMNLVFAYILITGALALGTQRALLPEDLANASQVELMVAQVLPGSPAALAGLLPGDSLIRVQDGARGWSLAQSIADQTLDPKSFSAFVNESKGSALTLEVRRSGAEESITATPAAGVAAADPTRYALGIEIAPVGIVPLSIQSALVEGVSLTWTMTVLTAQGLWHFFYNVFTLSADLSQVAGPVGIASIVGNASNEGIASLLSIMAIISINLAIINLIPVPALDGGRLLFVLIESVIRRPINQRLAQAVNAVGFALLILLMLVVTVHDIFKIVS